MSFMAVISDATTAVLLVNDDKNAVDKPSFVTDFTKLPLDNDWESCCMSVVFSIAIETSTNNTRVMSDGFA